MKKLFLILALMVATLAASANEIIYFTAPQASRTVKYLNAQNELVIYCGYADELETFVIVNEVWAEQLTTSFYEIWLHGYDAYTGEEIYMPIDLNCIWLLRGTNMYNAAQYLRFRCEFKRPTVHWVMPTYNHFVRCSHPHVHYYSHHYDVHRHGWKPYTDPHFHPYYMRHSHMLPPVPPMPFTPGVDAPAYRRNSSSHGYEYLGSGNTSIMKTRSTAPNQERKLNSGDIITSNFSTGEVTTTSRSNYYSRSNNASNSRSEANASSRSEANTSSRSNGTTATRSTTNTSSRSEANTSSRSNGTTATRSTNTSSRSNSTATSTRSTSTSSRSTSTPATSSTSSRSTATPSTSTRSTNTTSRSTSAAAAKSASTPSSTATRSTSNTTRTSTATRSSNSTSTDEGTTTRGTGSRTSASRTSRN